MDEEERQELLSMLRYFWSDYGDIERYTSYDEAIVEREFPEVLKAWKDHKAAEKMVTIVLRGSE